MGNKKVSPDLYAKFIEGINLLEFKMVYSEANVKEDFYPPAEVKLKEDSNYKSLENGKFVVSHKYNLIGKKKSEIEQGFQINVIYNLVYKSKTPITKKIFEIFSQVSLRIQTWPYFRQYVQEMTARMGLPPFVLDVLKFPKKPKKKVKKVSAKSKK